MGRHETTRAVGPPAAEARAERVKVLLSRVMRAVIRRQPRRGSGARFAAAHWGDGSSVASVIMGYVVDFHCAALRLVVEVDGTVFELRPDHEVRAADLRRAGGAVVRFSNDAVLYRLHDVLTVLAHRSR